MNLPSVTIIVATYNRPDVLEMALRSVIAQSISSWKVLVIGDNCDFRTGEIIENLACEKITYINLPKRFGEQSGPNSIGIALADTDYIAFLNHDDIWLPDHLELSLQKIEDTGADFLFAKSAVLKMQKVKNQWQEKFVRVTPTISSLAQAFSSVKLLFEPCSAWLLRRSACQRVGYWASAASIYRTPLQDWILRAWRENLSVANGDKVTVIKMNTHHGIKSVQGSYQQASSKHQQITQLLETHSAEEVRGYIDTVLLQKHYNKYAKGFAYRVRTKGFWQKMLMVCLFNRLTAQLFFYKGVDTYDIYARLKGHRLGEELRKACINRTGEDAIKEYSIQSVLNLLERQRHG